MARFAYDAGWKRAQVQPTESMLTPQTAGEPVPSEPLTNVSIFLPSSSHFPPRSFSHPGFLTNGSAKNQTPAGVCPAGLVKYQVSHRRWREPSGVGTVASFAPALGLGPQAARENKLLRTEGAGIPPPNFMCNRTSFWEVPEGNSFKKAGWS